MGRLRLAVVGKTLYAGRLTECIRKNAPEYLEVLSCLCVKELPEFLSRMQPDILLYEQGMLAENQISVHTLQIQLAEDEYALKSGKDDTPVIFRYQQGAEILRQVFQIYEQISKKNLICWCRTMNLEMTAFYAPGGHELLLPFSMAYTALNKEEGRVLYLNLSEFSGMMSLFGNKEGETFSDLIYGIRQKKERFSLCLQSVLHHTESFDYVLPPQNPQDLYEILEEDLACLLSLLREQTDYKLIVWSCGTFNQAVKQVLEYCGKVFCVVKESSFGKFRKAEFETFLEKESGQKLKEKLRYVNPQAGNGGFVQGADILTQLQSGEFAEQVRRLTQE